MAEGAQVLFPKHVFHSSENATNLLAALQYLGILHLRVFFRAGDTRRRNLAALNALDVARIIRRADQFVLAPPHELEQVVEELADVGSAHEVLETQIADPAAQEHPEILFVEHTETSAAAVEQSVAPRMEGAGLQAVDGGTLQ